MSIIEQATKRLEELRRGGVRVPWEAAGLSEERFEGILAGRELPGAAGMPAGGPSSRGDGRVHAAEGSRSAEPSRPAPQVVIDFKRLTAQGYLVPSAGDTDLAVEFRHLKRPLLHNVTSPEQDQRRNSLIMVSSALPGEGKTFCAVNLAMSMAMEVDTSVLLVDADVLRPSVMNRLGLPEQRGLLDLLGEEKVDVADVLLRTNVPKLSILPAGTRTAMAAELLGSAALDRLLTELATRYPDRVIILDSPPLLLTAESQILASRVGQVVIVVDSDNTTTSRVNEAFAAVESCPLVMAVLNKCDRPVHAKGYGYGYGDT